MLTFGNLYAIIIIAVAETAVYSSIAQSVERMTVNHDVTGSSPVRGATKDLVLYKVLFLV